MTEPTQTRLFAGRSHGKTQALIESLLAQANERGIRVEIVYPQGEPGSRVDPEDVEMVAKTLHAHSGRSARDFPWSHIHEASRNYYRDNARRLLTRLDEARANRTNRSEERR